MNGTAHITFKGGGLILPARTPYERELLVEYIEASVRRHGRLLLDVNRGQWTISKRQGLRTVCASCSRWPGEFTYPGGMTGRLAVVSARAGVCTDAMCELAQADERALPIAAHDGGFVALDRGEELSTVRGASPN
ncbi:MAG: hypothetical protein HY699_11490 [Deltaproteobacteria bacterium]|nr:hypothetical protein [Deltaproteobacteria bacterium]